MSGVRLNVRTFLFLQNNVFIGKSIKMVVLIGLIFIVGIIFVFFKMKSKASIEPQPKLPDLYTITTKDGKNSTEIVIDLNENEFIRKAKEGTLDTGIKNPEKAVEDIVGFYGSVEYSPNKEYCVAFRDGYYNEDKWRNGDIALLTGKSLLFKKKIQRPNDCHVSNDGVVICCDWQNSDELTGRFFIFGATGNQIFANKTKANLGTCAISGDSKIAIFETFYSETDDGNKIFIVDIAQKKVIHKIPNPISFNSADIETDSNRIKLKDHRGFIFEIDFSGIQTNKDDYENQILTKGTVYDRLNLYDRKPDEVKFKDQSYIKLLMIALNDNDASNAYGSDRIYRKIGEYYEGIGDLNRAIESLNQAILLNPKIGVKRKLEALKKQSSSHYK